MAGVGLWKVGPCPPQGNLGGGCLWALAVHLGIVKGSLQGLLSPQNFRKTSNCPHIACWPRPGNRARAGMSQRSGSLALESQRPGFKSQPCHSLAGQHTEPVIPINGGSSQFSVGSAQWGYCRGRDAVKGEVLPCSKARSRVPIEPCCQLRLLGSFIMTILLHPGCTQNHRNIKNSECWASFGDTGAEVRPGQWHVVKLSGWLQG